MIFRILRKILIPYLSSLHNGHYLSSLHNGHISSNIQNWKTQAMMVVKIWCFLLTNIATFGVLLEKNEASKYLVEDKHAFLLPFAMLHLTCWTKWKPKVQKILFQKVEKTLFTNYCSLITIHGLLFTDYCSQITVHRSLYTFYCSWHCSLRKFCLFKGGCPLSFRASQVKFYFWFPFP